MKKGFTLIELLAVIIILAVIALIAVPIIINVIEDSREKAAISSANGYVRAVNYKIAQEVLNDRIVDESIDYIIGENELAVTGNNMEDIAGSYIISNNRVLQAQLCVNNYSIAYFNGKSTLSSVNYCLGEIIPVYDYATEKESQSMRELCGGSNIESLYSDNSKFKVEKIDDLTCLATVVNGGKDFSGKTVYLLNDLDFQNTDDYVDSTLKNTVTTGLGFTPIGTNDKSFKGTFIGFAYTISNLMINRSNDYVGLFGKNEGTIKGVVLRNMDITGNSYTGGLVGYNCKTVKNVDVRGAVTGTGIYTGGIAGNTDYTGGASMNDVAFSGTVTGTNVVGGLVGTGPNAKGIVYDTTVTATNSDIGKANGSTYGGTYRVSNVTLNYPGGTRNSVSNKDGYTFSKLRLNNVDDAIDTYIGGDNDSDGYYFDYDSNNKIVLYSTNNNPILVPRKGAGDIDNPYLIRNVEDFRRATATIDSTAHYYSITNDLDFGNDLLYAMGTDTNKFNGIIDGNLKTLSNISIEGYNKTGLFGNITGTVKNIRINNYTATGQNNSTGIIGENNGTINGIIGRNITVTGVTNTGGLVGYNHKIVKNVDVRGTITGTSNYTGGVAGNTDYTGGASMNDVAFSGTVTGTNVVGGLVGTGPNAKGIVYDTTVTATNSEIGKVNGSTYGGTYRVSNVTLNYPGGTRNSVSNKDGYTFSKLRLNNVDDAIDTYIGGDNDSDGYYFDYDSNNKIVLYSTNNNPILVPRKGAGDIDNPYLIRNVEDFRRATATIDSTAHYYSITNDLDFGNDLLYAMGTDTNKFNGIIDGNLKTLSNISIEGYNKTGLFGNITGTVKNIRINNYTATGQNNSTGIIGENNGTVNGVIGRNITVTGYTNTGGLVGYNNKVVKNIDIRGSVTGTSTYTGGIAGNTHYTGGASIAELVFSGTVTGTNMVGGAVGNGPNAKGIVYNSTITATTTDIGRANGSTYGGTFKSYNVTLNYPSGTRNAESNRDGAIISSLTLENVDGTIDTTINGDSGSDGYYYTLVDGYLELTTAN